MRRFAFTVLLCACVSAPAPQHEPSTKSAAPAVTPSPVPPSEPKPAAERMAADTPRSTPAGVTFTAPAGWSVLPQDPAVILEPPEADSHIVVGVQAKDSDAAAAAAWKLYKPEMNRPIRIATDRPARNGWEQRRVHEYETSPNERAVVLAITHRAGEAWTVLLIDATEPTYERREAAARLIIQSLRPKGYQRESFAGRKPHPLDAQRVVQMKSFVETGMRELGVPGRGALRRGRMEERGRVAQERRRDDLVHHHRSDVGQLRIRDGAARGKARADHPRWSARIFLRRGPGRGCRSEIADALAAAA